MMRYSIMRQLRYMIVLLLAACGGDRTPVAPVVPTPPALHVTVYALRAIGDSAVPQTLTFYSGAVAIERGAIELVSDSTFRDWLGYVVYPTAGDPVPITDTVNGTWRLKPDSIVFAPVGYGQHIGSYDGQRIRIRWGTHIWEYQR